MTEQPTVAEQVLSTWGRMTSRLIAQDSRVVDLLLAEGPATQAELAEQVPGTSTWTWRRLSTGVHKDEVRGEPLIQKAKAADGTKVWEPTRFAREAAAVATLTRQFG